MRKLLLLLAGLFWGLLAANAQPFQPTRAEIMQRYHKARLFDSIATRSIFKASVKPHWAADNHSFWYRNILKDSVKEYIIVDAVHGTRQRLTTAPADNVIRRTGFDRLDDKRWADFSTDSLSPDKQWVAYLPLPRTETR